MSDGRPPHDAGPGEDPSLAGAEDREADGAAAAFATAATLLELGRAEDAREAAARALVHAPEDPDLRQLHATARLAAEDVEGAAREAERLAGEHPAWSRPQEILARAHLIAGRHAAAAAAAREAVRLEPDGAEGLLLLGWAELEGGRPGAAIEAGRGVLRRDPEAISAHVLLGAAELRVDEAARALEHFDAALRLAPEDASVLNDRGVALLQLGREEEAQRAFTAAGRIDPTVGEARANYADQVRADVLGRWVVPSGCFLLLWGTLRLAVPPHDVGGAVQLLLGAGLLAFGLLRARRRTALLDPQARRAIAGDRWWERLRLSTWRPWWMLGPRWAWPCFWLLLDAFLVWLLLAPGATTPPVWFLSVVAAASLVSWTLAWRHYAPRLGVRRARRGGGPR